MQYRNGVAAAAAEEETGVILGVDGGTTTTVCVCLPAASAAEGSPEKVPVLARAVAGCSNHNSVGEIAARETLEQVMAEALSKAGADHSAVRAVCLAVSGVNHPTDKQRILNWLRDIFPSHVKFYVENDAVAALASGTMGKLHGCALTAVIRAHDGRGPPTNLSESILDKLKLSSPDELIGWTYADPSWARIAALVPIVVSSAEEGDEVANKILSNSVEELADSVIAVVRRLSLCGKEGKDSFPLVMVGGVLESNKGWDIAGKVTNCISKVFPGAHPIRPEVYIVVIKLNKR
ncbi:N-acetyl-D-glucosamine kinase, partial [Ananas comosus]